MFQEFEDGLTMIDSTQYIESELEIEIPFNYKPYPFQSKPWEAKKNGYRNFVFVWHRRAGKDKTLWNIFISFIIDEWETPGMYFYCLPTATQAKKVIWNGIDNDGFKFLDHIPRELIKSKTKHDMTIELINGAIIQLVGSDNYDRLVGSNPKGLCFSEYSVGNPLGWEFMRPVLKRNGGWALFPYTPRGKNHGYTLLDGAKKLNAFRKSKGEKELWYVQVETIETTQDHDGKPLLTANDIEEERILGMSEDLIQQEYYCSFDAAVQGSIYADQMRAAHSQGRVRFAPLDNTKPIYISADIGRSDAAAWWFIQLLQDEIRVVHYYENTLKDTEHFITYINEFKNERNCLVDTIILPHDAKHKTMNAPISVEQKFKKAKFKVAIAPPPAKVSREEGIQQVRKLFPKVTFNEGETEIGVSALTSYRRKYDEVNKIFSKEPLHDWASNGADGFRMFAVWYDERNPQHQRRPMGNKTMSAKNGYGKR